MSKAFSFYAEGFCMIKEALIFCPGLLPALPDAMHVK